MVGDNGLIGKSSFPISFRERGEEHVTFLLVNAPRIEHL